MLVQACDSILSSCGIDLDVQLVNNAADDALPATVAAGRARIAMIEPLVNIGFCAAVNLALRTVSAPYVAFVNQDARLAPDYLAKLVDRLDKRPDLGAAGGRILRRADEGSPIVDSLGLAFLPGRRHVDIGHGKRDDGRRAGTDVVFGVTAAAAVYRRQALAEAAVEGEVLPEAFFMYLDDVDLAWRLQGMGYAALVDHSAIAWHERASARGVTQPGHGLGLHIRTLRRHAQRPDYVRLLSLVNHALMLVRNDDPDAFLAQLPTFAARRLPLEAFTVLQRPSVAIAARKRLLSRLPDALRQRAIIQRRRLVPSRSLVRWLP